MLLALEAAFRLVPSLLPYGTYGAGRFDPELRMNVHDITAIYNKVRYVRRVPNSDGFMDVDHEREKPRGVTRIGFFGDSYVQSSQVPLEQVFFRLLDARLGPDAETFGFGVSGWGTFHAMRAWQVFGPRYDIDRVIYVFVENDLGDQARAIVNPSGRPTYSTPYVEEASNSRGYRVVWPLPPEDTPLLRDIAKYIQRRSLVAHVVWQRIGMLRTRGVAMRARQEDAEMTTRAGGLPGPNDLAGSWPEPYARLVRNLGERVLRDWAGQVRSRGQSFAVLYVPRGEAHLRGDIGPDDSWLPWLERTCAELDIPLIDPSAALRRRLASGDAVYDDHWSPAGHEAVAGAVAEWLRGRGWDAPEAPGHARAR